MVAKIKELKKNVDQKITIEQHINHDELENMIAEAAYYKAANRGFASDHALEDWLEAEKEVLSSNE